MVIKVMSPRSTHSRHDHVARLVLLSGNFKGFAKPDSPKVLS